MIKLFVGLAVVSLAVIVVWRGFNRDNSEPRTQADVRLEAPPSTVQFTDVTAASGIADRSERWPDGTHALPEITGGGVALFDADGDGDLDILQICCPPPGRPDDPAPNRLYAQQADGTFLDATVDSGLGDPGYGQGVAIGDADNDGDLDVYVTNFGPDAFYRNEGGGQFLEATAEAGFSGDHWSTSAAFVDFDRDGDLDLYVVHYVEFNPALLCEVETSPDYCGPQNFKPVLDALYRNDGTGTFTDVTREVGIDAPGKGLGTVCADVTRDGFVDFYIANDGEANQLWVNDGQGRFSDEARLRGVALNIYGEAEASMGVALGDVNGDARPDLFMTHLTGETNTLYMSMESALFSDHSDASGTSANDLRFTGFGCGFFDYDNDGDLDLAIANGRVKRGPPVSGANLGPFWNAYAEGNLILENDGRGEWAAAGGPKNAFASQIEVGRGLAFGDFDQDGDVDLVLGNLHGPPRVFRNDSPAPESHWLLVRALVGKRDAIGAEVTLTAGEKRFVRLVLPGYSYASSSDPRVHFGLGEIERIDAVEVNWADGSRESFDVDGVNRQITVQKGKGTQR